MQSSPRQSNQSGERWRGSKSSPRKMPRLADWFFLTELVTWLEAGVRLQCPEYTGNFGEQIMVLGSPIPYFAYVVSAFTFYIDRTVTSAALMQGMFLNGIITWLSALALERALHPIDTGCGHVRALRPAAACGIVWFVFFFWQFYEGFSRGGCGRWATLTFGRFQVLVFAAWASAAQITLKMFHPYEVCIAVGLAFLSAVVTSLILHKLVIPWMQSPWFVRFCGWFCIRLDHPRYAPREGFQLVPVIDTSAERAKLINSAYAENFTAAGVLAKTARTRDASDAQWDSD